MDHKRIDESETNPFRQLPAVETLLKAASQLLARWGHEQVAAEFRSELNNARQRLAVGDLSRCSTDDIISQAAANLERRENEGMRTLLNLSGTVIHTNLGRASLPPQAIAAVSRAAAQPSNLEYDLTSGERGDRDDHVESLLCELTGAEAATVVNNNAAAVLLILNTFALGKQVPVSRGELVEIGGSFRIPEVMQRAGTTLVEVGATNRTHVQDYEQAIDEHTALLMKVHTSNYRVEGFTKAVSEPDLSALARNHDLPFVIDLGSGSLVDFVALGLPPEPTAAEAIANGADLITFSGDKLLGGPQAGMIAGRKDLIQKIKKNPLKRALRLDKMTIAALTEVLKLYRHPERLTQTLPTLRLLTRPLDEIETLAQRVLPNVSEALADRYHVSVVPGFSQIGSGALPIETLPTACLEVRAQKGEDQVLRSLATEMRKLPTPIIGRLHNGALLLDLRCLEDERLFLEMIAVLDTRLD
ncbi:MAG: L-seryl-tRNA(Sec) selenium transferase [Pseudomonadota bacterium]